MSNSVRFTLKMLSVECLLVAFIYLLFSVCFWNFSTKFWNSDALVAFGILCIICFIPSALIVLTSDTE
jgi:hypothetical protein